MTLPDRSPAEDMAPRTPGARPEHIRRLILEILHNTPIRITRPGKDQSDG